MYHPGWPVYLSKVPAISSSIKVFFLKISYILLQAFEWVYFSCSFNFTEHFYLFFFSSIGCVLKIFSYFIRICSFDEIFGMFCLPIVVPRKIFTYLIKKVKFCLLNEKFKKIILVKIIQSYINIRKKVWPIKYFLTQ